MYGPHVSRDYAAGTRPSMTAHLELARQEADDADFKMAVASVFVGGPQNRTITLQEAERPQVKEFIKTTGIRIIAHSSYTAVPWRGDPDAAKYIREELIVCHAAGIGGLVTHLPKLPPAEVMKYIGRLVEPMAPGVRLYLETPAVKPADSFYETPVKLRELFRQIRTLDPGLDVFGLCFDTAHLWTCGVDLQDYGAADEWLRGLEAVSGVIPHDRVMIHLNDSARARGVGPDTHAGLAAGKIWGEYRGDLVHSGLAAVVDYASRHDTPAILERKPRPALLEDYKVLNELIPVRD